MPFFFKYVMLKRIPLLSGNYETDLTLHTVDRPEYILLFIPGGVKRYSLPFYLIPWCLKMNVSVAVFELTKNFETTGMPAKFRLSKDRQLMLSKAIDYLATQYPGIPIMCFGHSFGALEAAYLAMREDPVIQKIVISNGTWVPTKETDIMYKDAYVQHFESDKISTPTLILHHVNDQTEQCPYNAAKQHMQALPSITVRNGFPHLGNPGTEPGPHFYTGQEAEVFANIHKWFKDEIHSENIG